MDGGVLLLLARPERGGITVDACQARKKTARTDIKHHFIETYVVVAESIQSRIHLCATTS